VDEMYERTDQYVIEREFIHAGLRCLVLFNVAGFRCGYVGVDKDHRLFGKDYSDHLEDKVKDGDKAYNVNEVSFLDLLQSLTDGSPNETINSFFYVHGGVDFSDYWPTKESKYAKDGLWYFGFACNHIMDVLDADSLERYFPNTDPGEIVMLQNIINQMSGLDASVKDANFVEEQLRSLAEQLQAYEYQFDPDHDPSDVMDYMAFVAPKARHIIQTANGLSPDEIIHPELGKVLFSQMIMVHVDEKKKKRKKKKGN
jgi:hypothetical protein